MDEVFNTCLEISCYAEEMSLARWPNPPESIRSEIKFRELGSIFRVVMRCVCPCSDWLNSIDRLACCGLAEYNLVLTLRKKNSDTKSDQRVNIRYLIKN